MPASTRRAGPLLLVALLAASAYAAFAHGATGPPTETRVQVALALLLALAVAAWLWDGGLLVHATGLGWLGVLVLAAFAAWTGTTVLWSISPDSTWTELNRVIGYLLVLLLAIAVGSSYARALEVVATGFLAVAMAVALYALGGKVAPGLHVGGLFDLNHTFGTSRLRAPLEYWNALGLVCALAAPVALRIAADPQRGTPGRLVSLACLLILLAVLGMTYSRGAMLALAVATIVAVAFAEPRLRAMLLLALAAFAVVVPLGFAFSAPDLTANGVPVGRREDDGLILGALLVVALAGLLLAGYGVMRLERRLAAEPGRARRWAQAGAVAAGAALLILVLGAAAAPSVRTERSAAGDPLTAQRQDDKTDPRRLTSTNSGNRSVWWREAAGAFADKPVVGWGAGSFFLLHLRYRQDQLTVLQPHSVPLQWAAETGAIGLLLGLGALGLLLAAALQTVRRLPMGSERAAAAALLAAGAAWLVHSAVDWDWDIPGVTIPAFLFLGVLAGRGGGLAAGMDAEADEPARRLGGATSRTLGLVLVSLLSLGVVLAAVLPNYAKGRVDDAVAGLGSSPSDNHLDEATRQIEAASRLDPLSVDGYYAAASIAQRRGDLPAARVYLVKATKRQPDNVEVWVKLARIELLRGDTSGLARATRRALALDPRGESVLAVAMFGERLQTPAAASPTATGTPLAPGGG
jgi:O-Antigen ligase